ncbi:hypothetical protein IGI04_028922 [Brassica rapa subsp. trilocularis]|uniref:Zinc finger GRF-type domain-containing protein n=1 Tax=Brassica rapa subsp. trilocularis TaxID=1813537 RepID=A0ABQ7L5J6_BRACM|nr:hypothetical protein IGI04_028922 [Brassica rapa subsp. trilocularis]
MEEELRDMKAHKAYYNMLHFVSEAQQGIPKLCPCGSITKEFVDEEDSYDYLPGKKYFICKDYQNDGMHFRQPWVMGVQQEIERLKHRMMEQEKLQLECEALKNQVKMLLQRVSELEKLEFKVGQSVGNFVETRIVRVSPCRSVPEPEERPIGVKAAKAAKKRKKTGKEEELAKLESLLEIKKQISKQSLLESLLAKPEPLSEMESALKIKLMSAFLDVKYKTMCLLKTKAGISSLFSHGWFVSFSLYFDVNQVTGVFVSLSLYFHVNQVVYHVAFISLFM